MLFLFVAFVGNFFEVYLVIILWYRYSYSMLKKSTNAHEKIF